LPRPAGTDHGPHRPQPPTVFPTLVEQAGPRQLWDEITTAYRWWLDTGQPAVTDWLITIGPDSQTT
jgi:hypothetical protein